MPPRARQLERRGGPADEAPAAGAAHPPDAPPGGALSRFLGPCDISSGDLAEYGRIAEYIPGGVSDGLAGRLATRCVDLRIVAIKQRRQRQRSTMRRAKKEGEEMRMRDREGEGEGCYRARCDTRLKTRRSSPWGPKSPERLPKILTASPVAEGLYLSGSLITAAQFPCHECQRGSPDQVDVLEFIWHDSSAVHEFADQADDWLDVRTVGTVYPQAAEIFKNDVVSGPMDGADGTVSGSFCCSVH
ncbi:hypothetical protein FB451DRAFT_1369903 [Mycena latifolia]|nr:hypothetical protein FB451DRAFT_1369903 [Mycena latifolia]